MDVLRVRPGSALVILFDWDERVCRFTIVPTIDVRGRQAQSAEHTLDLFAVFGRMVDGLDHDHPGLHIVPIPGLDAAFLQ
jgi:hypothetical protein